MPNRGRAATVAGLVGFFALQGADASLGLAWACLVIAAAVALWRDAIDLSRAPDALEWSLLALLLVAVLASLWGLDPRRSLTLSVPLLAALPLWFLLVRSDAGPALLRWVAPALGTAALLQLTLVLVAAWRDPGADAAAWVRFSGAAWLVVPNDLAWMACLLPLLRLSAGRWLELAAALALVLLALWMHSLTLLAAAPLAVLAHALLRRGLRLYSLPWLAPIAVALVGLLLLAALWVPSMHARLQLWTAALQVFTDHPLGVGLHNFVLAYRESSAAEGLVDPRLTPWPHSLPLEVLAELGAPGLLALIAVALNLRRRAASVCVTPRPWACASTAALLVFALLALTESSFLRLWVWTLGPLLAGLLVLQSTVLSNDKEHQ
ncbi:MAG: O-antigen ligase family protein [Rhodanobacteraceae bacterium]|nr:O-antigen ligase family protein [Rhodanobacteraceae bacterium]